MSTRVKRFTPKAAPVPNHPAAAISPKNSLAEPLDNRWRSGIYWFIAIALFVIPFGWGPGYMHPYNRAFYLMILVATISLVALWWATGRRAIKFVYTPFFLGVAAWLFAKLLTTFTSMLPALSFWGTYEIWADGFVYALSVSVIAAVLITLRLDTKRIVRLIHLVGVQALAFGVITIYQAIQKGFFYQKVRPDTPLLNPDFFLSYVLLFWPVALVLLVINLKNRRWAKAAGYAISTLILSCAMFVTLPTHLQTILLPTFMHGKKDTTSGATDSKSINASNFTEDNANMERWSEWKLGIKLGSYRPLVGTGPSTTGAAFIAKQNQLDLRTWNHDAVMQNAHNDLIEQFSQEGILGLLAYVFLWFSFIWVLIKNRRKIEPDTRPYVLGLGAGLLLWFGFNQLLFTTAIVGLFVWTWIAMLLSLVKAARPIDSLWPKPTIAILSVGLIMISIYAIHGYIDDSYVFNAESVNGSLKSGAFNSLSSDQVAYIAKLSASQQDAAADDLSYVGYYANDAALSSIDLYIDFPNASDRQTQAANALKYARQAVADDPYAPGYIQTLGGIEYYLAAPGSPQEAAGIALMNKAIALTPDAVAWYNDASAIAQIKKDYPLARSFIERGLKVAKAPADRQALEYNLAKLGGS